MLSYTSFKIIPYFTSRSEHIAVSTTSFSTNLQLYMTDIPMSIDADYKTKNAWITVN
uniref:Uncharacterized protein n=1 Tax=Heterorhabditis bacteriophora TaxID=37862 RepID=A0A1I7WJE2_HETBA